MTIQEDRQQLFLELINRARLDPLGEAARFNLADLNNGLAAGTISSAAKQVLAFNEFLYEAATEHNQYLIVNDIFAHEGQSTSDPFTTRYSPSDRIAMVGYGEKFQLSNGSYGYSFGSGENLAWRGTTGTLDANAEVYLEHRDLFLSAGHRRNTLNANYEEIGVSAIFDSAYQGFNALVTTQNFGYKLNSPVFVTGVVYTDTDNDNFYSIGESDAGRSVQLLSGSTVLGTTATANAGGYQIQTTASGAVEIVYFGPGLVGDQGANFVLGASNVKFDLVDGNTIQTNVSATLTRQGRNLTLLSIDNVNGTGNDYDNLIIGNRGNNILDGGVGNDTIFGGAGIDTVLFSDTVDSYTVTYASAGQIFTFVGADSFTDTVTEVEFFQFSDGTFSASQIQSGATSIVTANAVARIVSTSEGTSITKTITFEVRLSNAVLTQQTIDYTFSGIGASPTDASDVFGNMSGTLTFAAGETLKTLSLNIVTDGIFEANKSIALTLLNASSKIVIGNAVAITVIVNDDIAPVYKYGTELSEKIIGTSNTDLIFGIGGNDVLSGSSGIDSLEGGAGNDTLDGGLGVDVMIGGTGDDTYIVDNVFDLVDESTGDGIDLLKSSISFNLSAALGDVENLLLTGSAALIGTGNHLSNVITGNGGANILFGLAGDDTLDGGLGNDTMYGGTGDDTYIVNSVLDIVDETIGDGMDTVRSSVTLSLSNTATIRGDVENLTLTGAAALNGTGNGLANTLIGNSGANILAGLGGADVLDGGLGIDTASYSASTSGVDVSLSRGTGFGGDAESDTLISIENLIGSRANDVLAGNAGNNILDGGLGIDTVSYASATAGIKISLALTSAQATIGAGTDTLRGFENIIGSDFNDILIGSSLANSLEGGAGNDTLDGGLGVDVMIGGTGDDTYIVDNVFDLVDESTGDGIDLLKSSISFNLSAALGDVENLLLTGSAALIGTGNHLSNVITGNGGANILFGLAGDDTLDGGLGNDTMYGGTGDDTYIVNSVLDIVDETIGDGMDTVRSSVTLSLSNTATIRGDVENLTLTGAAALNGTGNGLANTLIGNSGANILAGLGGADVLDGGLGIDTASYSASTSGVDVSLSRGTGFGGDAESDTLISIENLIGSRANDVLAGNAGNNILDGGLGIDTVSYASATAGIKISLALTSAQATIGAGTDTLRGFENIIGSDFNDILIGSSLANSLEGGAGNDTLDGGLGVDVFIYNQTDFGADIIKNFQNGMDKLQFNSLLADSIYDFSLTGNGTNSVLLMLGGDSIQLTSTSSFTLSADDFVFF